MRIIVNPKLVFRFSEEACGVCVDMAIADLLNIKSQVKDSDILVITSFSNNRDFIMFKQKLNRDYNYINCSKKFNLTNNSLKNIINPHFFILETDLVINCFYIYLKEIPLLNELYFNEVSFRLNKNIEI